MLKIRLSMGGVRKRPVYKIVVADSRAPRDGRFVEETTIDDIKKKQSVVSYIAEKIKTKEEGNNIRTNNIYKGRESL